MKPVVMLLDGRRLHHFLKQMDSRLILCSKAFQGHVRSELVLVGRYYILNLHVHVYRYPCVYRGGAPAVSMDLLQKSLMYVGEYRAQPSSRLSCACCRPFGSKALDQTPSARGGNGLRRGPDEPKPGWTVPAVWGLPKGALFESPRNNNYSIFRSILGPPTLETSTWNQGLRRLMPRARL